MMALRNFQWPPFVDLMQSATWLGYGAVDVGLLAVLAAYGWWDGDAQLRARGIVGAVTVAGAGLLDQVVKNVACRARPNAPQAGAFLSSFPCFPASYAYASFPSGHATTAFATALILAFWYPRQTGLFVGLAILVGLSRVVLGAHFPSDVLAGAVLGSGVALIVHAYVPMVRKANGEGMRLHS
ncbi:MAG TPA: phosphatase PAP2 family protein [Candidatus Methylomirabilis sp.]|nr:phosphatase PAP2 family protein [Candidatus Methylomirabilis sp.]HSC71700.1 phosphatase PAP2 family protein [Candidatus Methylomirabilis sp.]